MITLLTSVRNVYFAARQQCKGNPLLLFHGNTQRLYTADSYVYLQQQYKGKAFLCFHSNNDCYVLRTLPILLRAILVTKFVLRMLNLSYGDSNDINMV